MYVRRRGPASPRYLYLTGSHHLPRPSRLLDPTVTVTVVISCCVTVIGLQSHVSAVDPAGAVVADARGMEESFAYPPSVDEEDAVVASGTAVPRLELPVGSAWSGVRPIFTAPIAVVVAACTTLTVAVVDDVAPNVGVLPATMMSVVLVAIGELPAVLYEKEVPGSGPELLDPLGTGVTVVSSAVSTITLEVEVLRVIVVVGLTVMVVLLLRVAVLLLALVPSAEEEDEVGPFVGLDSAPRVEVPITSAVGFSTIGTCQTGSVEERVYGSGSLRSSGRSAESCPLSGISVEMQFSSKRGLYSPS